MEAEEEEDAKAKAVRAVVAVAVVVGTVMRMVEGWTALVNAVEVKAAAWQEVEAMAEAEAQLVELVER